MSEPVLVMKLRNGVKLYETPLTRRLEQYATAYELEGIRVYLAEQPDGYQEYLIVQGDRPVFASQKYEDACVHIDMMYLAGR